MAVLTSLRREGAVAIVTSIAPLILAISLMQLANGFIGTLIGLGLAGAKTEPLITGLVMSSYFGGYVLGAATCHRLIARIGHIRAFAAFAALVAIAFLCHALYFSAAVWALLRAITGFGCAGLFVATESWLNARATAVSRGAVFGAYMVATYATLGGGQFMVNVAPPTDFTLYSLAAILFCIGLLLVTTMRAEQPAIEKVQPLRRGELAAVAPVAVAGCLIAGALNGVFFALVPAVAQSNGRSTAEISLYMALAILGGLCLQMPVGKLSDRFDRRIVVSLVALLFAGLALAIAPARQTAWFSPVWFLFGGFLSVIYPLCVAHANDRSPPEQVVGVSGRLILIFGAGSALGPLLGSVATTWMGFRGLFYFMATLAAAFAIFALTRTITVKRPSSSRSWPTLFLPNAFTQGIAQSSQIAPSGTLENSSN